MEHFFHGFDRIASDPEILGGKPCIRGTRISVQRVLEIVADNPDWEDLRADYPGLDRESIRQALAFAASALSDDFVPFESPAA